MFVAKMATDWGSDFRYKRDMNSAKRFSGTKPASPMNEWVREAILHSGRTAVEIADLLNAEGLQTRYDRSKIQKMTTVRRVTVEEAKALARITGYPLDADGEIARIIDDLQSLDRPQLLAVQALIGHLRNSPEGGE